MTTPTKTMLREEMERFRAITPSQRVREMQMWMVRLAVMPPDERERFIEAYNTCNPLDWPEE